MHTRARLVGGLVVCTIALVFTAGGAANPAAEQSANGRIAFGYRGRLIITNPDGTGQWPLTLGPGQALGDWSPDGTRLVVAYWATASQADLYLVDARGKYFDQLISSSTGQYAIDPSFSPDATQIAYESFRADRAPQIWVMNVRGTSQRFVPAGWPAEDPDWSPNGKRIAWTHYGGDPEIWVMNYDGTEGSERRRLTNHPAVDENPSWSPDGTRIAFDTDRGGNLDVYTMRVDGSDVRQLTTSPALDAIPAWSPDGRWIAFMSERTGRRALFVMDAQGRHETQLSPWADRTAGPAWQPLQPRPQATNASEYRCANWGTDMDDLLVGTPGRDVICGLGGNDRMLDGEGRDVIVGAPGNDSIVGGPGADVISAGPGDDSVDARDGDPDAIKGGGGRDVALVDRELDRGFVLASAFDPDPGNLTRGRPVRASSATLADPVEYAVDGYTHTFWDSDRYTRAWIQVDLGRFATVGGIELVVFQDEPDLTTHFVVLGKGRSGRWRRLASFQRETPPGHVLRYSARQPWRGVRWIRIVTRASGSLFFLKELRAYAP